MAQAPALALPRLRDLSTAAEITRRELSDGSLVEVDLERVVVRGPDGLIRVRYEGGSAEVVAATGDLVLAAPSGRVRLSAGVDVEIEASRDITQRVVRKLEVSVAGAEEPALRVDCASAKLRAPAVEIEARAYKLVAEEASVLARVVTTTAESVATHAARFEVRATRLVERARDTLREVAELAETRAGRVRNVVRGAFTLRARHTAIASKEETSVDGSSVLLG